MTDTAVKEKSTAFLTVTFKDKTGALAVPAWATWQVHDPENNTVLLIETAIAPLASSVELTLTPIINTFINSTHAEEVRRVTVKSSGTASTVANDEFDYNILDLTYLP